MSNEAVTRFAADRMLLRLARWLRFAGVDVIDDRSLSGDRLLTRARLENRILLTRDKRLRTARDVILSSTTISAINCTRCWIVSGSIRARAHSRDARDAIVHWSQSSARRS